ncbi:MAG: hypothetical protein EBY32_18170, partial [Proteobacteria bacterium]|nr:hypothetical protein [Pseudomonadota bacterium]
RSGILTARHPTAENGAIFLKLEQQGIVASLRTNRDGKKWLRFSPHFYNTPNEMDQVADVVLGALTRSVTAD